MLRTHHSSFLNTQVLLYASDRLTPLDVFTMNLADGGCNPIMDSGAFGTVVVTLNDTSRELYPYTVGDNSDTYRSAVLVAGTTSEFPRTGSLTGFFEAGVSEFAGALLPFPVSPPFAYSSDWLLTHKFANSDFSLFL
jgi:hypothetical protein